LPAVALTFVIFLLCPGLFPYVIEALLNEKIEGVAITAPITGFPVSAYQPDNPSR
jgi:hypothetical protein